MQTIMEHAGQLVVVRCWCGVQHAVPESLRKQQLAAKERGDNMEVFCPLGHKYIPGSGLTPAQEEAARLKRRLEYAEADRDSARAERDSEKRRAAAARGQVTKIKKRVGKGVCPCCNRHFTNLERHMQTQHPEFTDSDDSPT